MRCAVSEMVFSPALLTPMTLDTWTQLFQSASGCKEARQIQWLYSLVSVQGDRSRCVYQVPYTDLLREAYREAQIPFQRVWQAQEWLAQEPKNFQGKPLIVVEVHHDPPLTRTTYEVGKQQAEGCFRELNIQPLWSLVTVDGTRSNCVFSAATAEDVRSLYRKLNTPFDHVWKAILIHG